MKHTIAVIYETREMLESWLSGRSLAFKDRNTAVTLDGTICYKFFSTNNPEFMRGYEFHGCVVLGSVTTEAWDEYSRRAIRERSFK